MTALQQKKWKPLYESAKHMLLPTVRIEYNDLKREREMIKERVLCEYKERYGQVMRMYHITCPMKRVYTRLDITMCNKGCLYKREETIKLYFDETIPYEIIQSMKQERLSVSINKRIRLKMVEDGRVSYVRVR